VELLEQYFRTARERERIRIHRSQGLEPKDWTVDPVFQFWRFCNVRREDDKTTVWFRENVRNALLSPYRVTAATVIFRWFNRIETGELIKDLLLEEWNTEEARRRLKDVTPVVTGAYIIKGPDYMTKLDGVLYCVDRALPQLKVMVENWGPSLQSAWEDLCTIYYLGKFMSYEVVSDLRWTPVLNQAKDICTWANAGPGCARGLGWVLRNNSSTFNSESKVDQKIMLELMEALLYASREDKYWPVEFPRWEMREVEHWACEFDKYKRGESGNKLKRRFNGPSASKADQRTIQGV
jgi:hypothetical protein